MAEMTQYSAEAQLLINDVFCKESNRGWDIYASESLYAECLQPKQLKIKKEPKYDDLRAMAYWLQIALFQTLELKEKFAQLRKELAFVLERENSISSFEEIVSKSPALRAFIGNKKISEASRRVLIASKEKIERLYKDGKFQSNLDKFRGVIEIKDKKIAEEFFK